MPPASTVCSCRYQANPSTPTAVMLPPKQPKRSTSVHLDALARGPPVPAASPPGPETDDQHVGAMDDLDPACRFVDVVS